MKWNIVSLSDILTARSEKIDHETAIIGDIPIISKIGFNTGAIELRDEIKTKTDLILIKPGDLVISGINAIKGAIAIYDEDNEYPISATIHYSSYIIDKNKVFPKYLWYYFRSNSFRQILLKKLPNGIKTELKPKKLLKLNIPLPSLNEQKNIVSTIQNFMNNVTDINQAQKASIYDSKKLIESCIQKIMKQFPDISSFGEVITFKPRSGPSFPTNPEWEGIHVLMPSSVTGFGINLSKVEYGIGNEKISEKDFLEPGDIIIARGNKANQVGNAGVVPVEAKNWVCANLLMRTRVDTSLVDPFFCIYWLRSPFMRKHVKDNIKGTNPKIQKINQQTILNYPYPLNIPLSTQHKIVNQLNYLQAKVDELKRLQEETERDMQELISSIFQKFFVQRF